MTSTKSAVLTRRGLMGVFAAAAVVAAPTYSNAFGLLRGAGDIRRVKMYSGRSGETVDAIYWIDGKYVPEVLKEINHFMRDLRADQTVKMNPTNLDIIAATHHLLDVKEPICFCPATARPRRTPCCVPARVGSPATRCT